MDDIDRLGLPSPLSNPVLISTSNFSSELKELLTYYKARGFDNIIDPILRVLKSKRYPFKERPIVYLFKASLESYRIQRSVYGRVREKLRMLCLECVEYFSENLKIKMMLALIEELISPSQMHNNRSAVFGFQLLGRLINEFGEKEEFLRLFMEKLESLEGYKAPSSKIQPLLEFVYGQNKDIADWTPPKTEEEPIEPLKKFFKPADLLISYENWEVEGSRKVIELFDRFQNRII